MTATEDDEQYEIHEARKARRRGDYSINPEAEELAAHHRRTSASAEQDPTPTPKPKFNLGIEPW